MTTKELLEKIKNGELPKSGIIGRTGSARDIIVTTTIDGETVVVPDIDMTVDEEVAE